MQRLTKSSRDSHPTDRTNAIKAAPAFLAVAAALAAAQAPYPVTTGKAYKFESVASGVYYATSTGTMATGSNNVAVVGERSVLVVDTGTSPAAARAFIED